LAVILVLNTPDDGRLRPKHVGKSSHLLIRAGILEFRP